MTVSNTFLGFHNADFEGVDFVDNTSDNSQRQRRLIQYVGDTTFNSSHCTTGD